jgi:hypothetical protein
MGEVVGQRTGLGVGHVLELERRADVAQRPDPLGRRPPVLVDLDAPVVPQADSGGVQAEVIGVRLASGGHQQQVAGHRRTVLHRRRDRRVPHAGYKD